MVFWVAFCCSSWFFSTKSSSLGFSDYLLGTRFLWLEPHFFSLMAEDWLGVLPHEPPFVSFLQHVGIALTPIPTCGYTLGEIHELFLPD